MEQKANDAPFDIYARTFIDRRNLIFQVVNAATGIDRPTMMGPRRSTAVVVARQVAQTMMLDFMPDSSMSRIGRIFARDHTTVLHSRTRVHAELESGLGARAELYRQIAPEVMAGFSDLLRGRKPEPARKVWMAEPMDDATPETELVARAAMLIEDADQPPTPKRTSYIAASVRYVTKAGYLDCKGALVCFPW